MFTGTLTDGSQFDSSRGRAPFTFKIGKGQVIQGWDEGIMTMYELRFFKTAAFSTKYGTKNRPFTRNTRSRRSPLHVCRIFLGFIADESR